MFIWMISISHLLTWLYPPPPPLLPLFLRQSEPEPPFRYTIFIALIWAPFWEEMFNRHAYGLIIKQIGSKFLLPTMLISSFIFGWLHGNGQTSILKQGMMGMVFFYVYVKNGYSWRSSSILHSLWNATVIFSPAWIW